jgi:CRP-like cAMP-binding protein
LYLLTDGSVAVLKGSDYGKMKLTEIQAPNFFGEMGLLSGKARSAGIRAQTQVLTGFLPTELFAAKLRSDNLTALRIGINLGRILSDRLSETNVKLAKKSAVMAKRRPTV